MNRLLIPVAVALAATAPLADAKDKPGKVRPNTAAYALAQNCPPGLAKKSPPCVPPGQAKRQAPILQPGDPIPPTYVVVPYPGMYGLDPFHAYYRVGDMVYRVDPASRRILAFVGALADLAQ